MDKEAIRKADAVIGELQGGIEFFNMNFPYSFIRFIPIAEES